jgi:hypothetical protein
LSGSINLINHFIQPFFPKSIPMKKHFINARIIALYVLFVACVLVTACSKKKEVTPDNTNTGGGTTKVDSTTVTNGTPEGSTEVGADPDDVYDATAFTLPVAIAFSGTTATITPATTKGVTITQTNGDVVITATATGVAYTVSGTTANGSVKIYSDKKFTVTLNGANITNLDGPAINIQSSKRMFLILADGTTNTLADGPTYTASGTEDQKGTFFAEGQVIVTGKGSLSVAGNYKHAICSDDYIRISSGNITVTNSISDGIHTNDQFIMDGGTLKITAGSDGIETEEGSMIFNDGNVNITATTGDGIKASYEGTDVTIIPYININGGTINVSAPSDEGISSKNALTINKGNVASTASDDAFSASTAININGGYVYAFSKTNDAMDSNGTFTLTGGTVVAIGSPAPESSIDCNANVFKITGGQLVGVAGTTSAPSTTSTINSVILGSGTAQIIHIEAADGTEALTFQSPIAYGTLVYASAKLKDNTAYNIYTGGTMASGTGLKGLFTSGTYTRGTKSATTFTTSSRVTKVGGTIATN